MSPLDVVIGRNSKAGRMGLRNKGLMRLRAREELNVPAERASCAFPFFPYNQSTTTPTLPDHTVSKDNMEQSNSLLLTKLPPELRVIVWDNALDAKTLHFESVDSRF